MALNKMLFWNNFQLSVNINPAIAGIGFTLVKKNMYLFLNQSDARTETNRDFFSRGFARWRAAANLMVTHNFCWLLLILVFVLIGRWLTH